MTTRLAARALVASILLGAALSAGCAHTVVIETLPKEARIKVNDEDMGQAPVVTTQLTGTGGRLYLSASAEGYETENVIVPQSEWFLWPALLAVVPLFGVPFVVIPILGPIITGTWALATSPALISLLFLQKYPERVQIKLRPRFAGGMLAPSDSWLIPDDLAPNPVPLSDPPPDASTFVEQPPQPDGGNPVP